MKISPKLKKSLTFFALVISLSFFGASSLLMGGQPYVKVVLKDKTVETFKYDSFTMNWDGPIKIKDQNSCEELEVTMDDIEEVYIVAEFFNSCDNKDDVEVDVYLRDKRQILGFFNVTNYSVKGELLATGEERTIAFSEIKKISFYK